jgi:hypothetical protein
MEADNLWVPEEVFGNFYGGLPAEGFEKAL